MAQAGGTRTVENDVSAIVPEQNLGDSKSSLIDLEAEMPTGGKRDLCL
jgi:hypothetical protein